MSKIFFALRIIRINQFPYIMVLINHRLLFKLVSREVNSNVSGSVCTVFIEIFAKFAGIILIGIEIVLKMYSH